MTNFELSVLPNPCHQEISLRRDVAQQLLDDPLKWNTYLNFMKQYSGLPYRPNQPEVGHLAGKPTIDVISAITSDGSQLIHVRRENSGKSNGDMRSQYYIVVQDLAGDIAPFEPEITAASLSQLYMRMPGSEEQLLLDMGQSFSLWRSSTDSYTGFHSFYDLNNSIYELEGFNVELPSDYGFESLGKTALIA